MYVYISSYQIFSLHDNTQVMGRLYARMSLKWHCSLYILMCKFADVFVYGVPYYELAKLFSLSYSEYHWCYNVGLAVFPIDFGWSSNVDTVFCSFDKATAIATVVRLSYRA